MAVDHLDIGRMALEDDGREVIVKTEVDPARTVTMLFDEPEEEVRIGHVPGTMNYPEFSCLPEDAAGIGKGTLLTMNGDDFLVFQVVPRRFDLTLIRVKEQ